MKRFSLLLLTAFSFPAHANSAVLIVEGDELRRNARESASVETGAAGGSGIGVTPEQVYVTDMTGNVNRVFISEEFPAKTVSGMARSIPLSDALAMVVPKDYQIVYRISRESQRLSVSWRGGARWTDILKEIMKEAKAYAFVDTQSKRVTISANPDNDLWDIYLEDRTVRIAVTRWTKLAGWQLIWDVGRDFDIEATATIQGDFKSAVETLVNSLSSSDYPVKAIFYDKSNAVRIVKYTAGLRSQK